MSKGGRKPGAKEPIRSLEKIDEMKEWLLRHSSYRNYFLFYFGISWNLLFRCVNPACLVNLLGIRPEEIKANIIIEFNGHFSDQLTLPTAAYMKELFLEEQKGRLEFVFFPPIAPSLT